VFENVASNTLIIFAVGAADSIPEEDEKFDLLCEDLELSGNAKFEVFGLADADAKPNQLLCPVLNQPTKRNALL